MAALLNYVRADWTADDLLPGIVVEVRERLAGMQQHWQANELLAAHHDVLARAVERFQAEDYVSTTAILYPRIEGVLRDIQARTGGSSFKQGDLVQAPMRFLPHPAPEFSRMLPSRFREYLERVYFAPFDPSDVRHVSRHTVAHGVVPVGGFSAKACVVGLLILEQICFHLPPEPSPPSSATTILTQGEI